MQTTEEQKNMILGVLVDQDPDTVVNYMEHCGFDFGSVEKTSQIPDAWLGHYRLGQGSYDVDRATMDLLTWPPIARRVFELQQEKASLAK